MTDTVFVEVHDTVKAYTPTITKYINKVRHDTIWAIHKVDTAWLIHDYFASRFYQDTIKVGSYGVIILKDTISENRIISRESVLDVKLPEITKTITQELPPKAQLYGGGEVLSGANPYLGANLLLKTKQDQIFQIGGGISPQGPMFKIGIDFKIKFK